MRSAAVFVALLLCLHWTWAQGESGEVTEGGNKKEEVQFEIQGVKATHDQSSSQTCISPDVWAELKELRDMAIEHRIKIERLEQENTATQARLTASESKNAALEARLSSSENEAEELKRENADRPKVVFLVGLSDAGNIRPGDTEETLKFSKVFTNIGQAYSPTTGIFTAPVRGAYYLRFTIFETRASAWVCAHLYHNNKQVMYNSDGNGSTGYVSASNALVLHLEKGDLIYMTLGVSCSIYDASSNCTTFGTTNY